ncbi:hypothetical protein [Lederbergia citrea]|uniref:Uncharacterized protein n=1 Tax=Lederbergia citrea TaxID=2833581 RepID=A0A942UNW1_9BACI|nr:hypothetical protein [Lederbergia citrea]MBS4223297.1 hypothetical protein [Lederbergia citrea]
MKEYEQLLKENHFLKQLLAKMMNNHGTTDSGKILTKKSPLNEKKQLLKSLFKGRSDVYALRWESNSLTGYKSMGYVTGDGEQASEQMRLF